ncbi:tetraspanin-14 isoform X1 [Bubalus kerabau]|nr:tetraspanin-14 isoform X1 [Bubalus carabanensis]
MVWPCLKPFVEKLRVDRRPSPLGPEVQRSQHAGFIGSCPCWRCRRKLGPETASCAHLLLNADISCAHRAFRNRPAVIIWAQGSPSTFKQVVSRSAAEGRPLEARPVPGLFPQSFERWSGSRCGRPGPHLCGQADPASQKMHYYRYSNAEVSCWYKYLLFSYNIVFWLAGVVFLGVGLWAWSEKGVLSDLTKVTRMHGIDPVVLVLMVGVVMFTLGFAGCVGALRENICLLNFFCSTIVLIFFLELAVAVLAFLFQDWVRDRFREFFESNIRSYRDDIDLQNLIDSLQKANQCCGAYGPEDWDLNVYFNCSGASYSREKCGVPFSCCVPDPAQKVVNTQCGYDVRTQLKSKWDESIFTKGCIQALESWLPRNIYIVAGVFIAISLLQIFGIFLARTLISDIEAVKAGHHF